MFDQLSFFYYSDAEVMHIDTHIPITISSRWPLIIYPLATKNISTAQPETSPITNFFVKVIAAYSAKQIGCCPASNVQKFKKRVKKSYITVGVDFTRDNSVSALGSPVYGIILL